MGTGAEGKRRSFWRLSSWVPIHLPFFRPLNKGPRAFQKLSFKGSATGDGMTSNLARTMVIIKGPKVII